MDRDPFGHRKYHGLYFILGFLIAFVAFMMLSGCEQPNATSGVEPERQCCMALTPECMAQCKEDMPEQTQLSANHRVWCHLYGNDS